MDRWDVIALLGAVLFGCGLWLIAPWLALTAVGAVLLAIGLAFSVLAERAAVRQELIDMKKGG